MRDAPCSWPPPAASRPCLSSERGFTIAESLFAALILTVGLVGTAELLAVTLRTHQFAQSSAQATRHAQAKLEDLMKANFSTTAAIQLTGRNSLDTNVTNYFDVPAPGYTRRWQVDPGPAADPQLRRVAVRVLPTQPDQRIAADVKLVTMVRSW